MPSGKPSSTEKVAIILNLREQGLTLEQIAIQVRLTREGVRKIILRNKRRANV